jgi:hypothetical protein
MLHGLGRVSSSPARIPLGPIRIKTKSMGDSPGKPPRSHRAAWTTSAVPVHPAAAVPPRPLPPDPAPGAPTHTASRLTVCSVASSNGRISWSPRVFSLFSQHSSPLSELPSPRSLTTSPSLTKAKGAPWVANTGKAIARAHLAGVAKHLVDEWCEVGRGTQRVLVEDVRHQLVHEGDGHTALHCIPRLEELQQLFALVEVVSLRKQVLRFVCTRTVSVGLRCWLV